MNSRWSWFGLIPFVLLALCTSLVDADDWPQWRGPLRDGVCRESGIVDAIPKGGLPVKWRTRVLNGWSGPAVASGRVLVTDHDYKSDPEVERVLCFDEQTGRRLWMQEYPCHYGNMEYGNGPRATPAVQDGLVYTIGTMGHLRCFDLETGAIVWKKEPQELNVARPQYGVSASPLIEGEIVIVSPGAKPKGTVIAFDRKTGVERWRALEDRTAYSSPIAIEQAGRRQVIVWTGDNVNSLDPQTGDVLWQVPYKATFDPAQATATPVVHRDKLLCLAAWNRGSMMLQLDQTKPGAFVLWKTRSTPSGTSSTPIFLHDKHIFAIVSDGSLSCLDAATGDEVWQTREPTSAALGMAHIVPVGDLGAGHEFRCFCLNQHGQFLVARLTPAGYQEFGRTLLIEPTAGYRAGGPVCWAHPAFANKHVFARNDRELVCVSLAKDSAATDSADELRPIESKLVPGIAAADGHQVLAVAVSPDGKTAAFGTGWGIVKQVELASGTAVPSVKRHNDWVTSVAYSPDGRYLVSAGGSEFTPERNRRMTSGEIKVWDRQTQAERGKFEGHTNKIFAATFSPDSKTLATGAADRTIRLWDIDSLKELRTLPGHTDAIVSLAWSRDNRVLASASWDKTVRLWNPLTGEPIKMLVASDEELMAVAISPDNRWLAAGGSDRTLRLWDIRDLSTVREPAATLNGHRGTIYALGFSPDGTTLASASGDETIRLWNLATQATTAVLDGQRSGVTSIAFTPDGRQLLSGSLNTAARIWDLVPTAPTTKRSP